MAESKPKETERDMKPGDDRRGESRRADLLLTLVILITAGLLMAQLALNALAAAGW